MKELYKILVFVFLVGFVSEGAIGQIGYVSSISSGTYTPISETAFLVDSDDANSATQSIGFTFNFNGTDFTQFIANSNGHIRLGSTNPTSSYSPISTTSNTNSISAAGRDGRSTGGVMVQTQGSAPNRICVIQYTDYDLVFNATDKRVNFQIKLYETTNVVEIIYNDAIGTTTTSTIQVGIRGGSGTNDYNNFKDSDANWASLPAGTANSSKVSWGSSQNATRSMPSDGRILRWTPCVSTTWLGGTSTSWTNAANWSCGVPTSATDVIIPSGRPNSPTIAAATLASCKDLTVDAGATLIISCLLASGGGFSIYGNIENNGVMDDDSDVYLNLYGVSKTIGGTGTFDGYGGSYYIIDGASYTLVSDIDIGYISIFNSVASTLNLDSYYLTVEYELIQQGTLNLGTGTLEYRGEVDYHTFTDSRFTESTGTFYYNGIDNNQTVKTGTYYNLKIGTHSGRTATIGSTSTVIVSNDLTIVNPGAAGGVATTAYDVTVGNNLNLANTGNALTLNLANRMYRGSGTGTLTMGDLASNAINVTYAHASNHVISGFTTPTFYGTFTYNSGSAQMVVPATYDNLTISGAGTRTLAGGITVDEDLTISAGTLDVSGSNYAINLAGDWSNSGTFTPRSGTVTFDGSGVSDLAKTSAGAPVEFENEDFSSGIPGSWTQSQTGTWASNVLWRTSGSTGCARTINAPITGDYLIVDSDCYGEGVSGTSTLTTQVYDFSSYSNCTLDFDHYYRYFNGSENVKIEMKIGAGSWSTLETWTSSTSNAQTDSYDISSADGESSVQFRFVYTGDYDYYWAIDNFKLIGYLPSSSAESFYNLTVNKTGGATVDLASVASISNSLTFTSGIITATDDYFPEFGVSATVGGSPSSTTHVNGPVRKLTNSTTAFTFPVGNGSVYRSIGITPTSTGATTWRAKYNAAAFGSLTANAPLDHVSSLEYWDLDRDAGSETATITLSWDANSGDITDYTKLVVAHYNGASWDNAGGNSITGNNTAGTVQSNAAWNLYSPFTIGTTDPGNALPVIMKVFNGDCQTDYIGLFWQTASEMNSSHFDIERSTDGFEWEVLGSLQGNGNSSSTKDYEWLDYSIVRQAQQTPVYYRLRQVDFDGKEEVFGPISVTCEKSGDLNLTVFPNPTQNNATLTFDWNKGKDDVLVTLTDASGKIIQQTETAIMNGTNSIYVELSDYSHGMYFITLEVNEERIGAVKLVKQ